MNKISLIGRLGRDPEVKQTANGKAVATFTLAVDRRFKNASGQKEADWINIVAWDKSAELIGKFVKKGDQIGIVGRLQIRNYDGTDGQKKYVTEVICEEFDFISSQGQKQENFAPKVTIEEVTLATEDDDEIPF